MKVKAWKKPKEGTLVKARHGLPAGSKVKVLGQQGAPNFMFEIEIEREVDGKPVAEKHLVGEHAVTFDE